MDEYHNEEMVKKQVAKYGGERDPNYHYLSMSK